MNSSPPVPKASPSSSTSHTSVIGGWFKGDRYRKANDQKLWLFYLPKLVADVTNKLSLKLSVSPGLAPSAVDSLEFDGVRF